MPHTHAQWEKYFQEENGKRKMDRELMREFNRTYEGARRQNCTEWPSTWHFVGLGPDAKTAAEADEAQGLNKKPIKGETYKDIVKRARVAISERDLDPYTRWFVITDMGTDTFGEDWGKLDVVRRRFVDDHDLITDLLKVVDALTERCKELKKRKRGDTDLN
jgi:hypothetical protein